LLTHNPAPLPEYKSSSVKRSRLIFSHYGLLKGVWDWLVVLATVYVAIAVPFLAAFVQQESRNLLPDIIVESLFIGGKDSLCLGQQVFRFLSLLLVT
jgi:potassium voltage-gated channel Eag-related subfamily H member 8